MLHLLVTYIVFVAKETIWDANHILTDQLHLGIKIYTIV